MNEFWHDYWSFLKFMVAAITFMGIIALGIGTPIAVVIVLHTYVNLTIGIIVGILITPASCIIMEKMMSMVGRTYRKSEQLKGYRHD